MSLGGGMPTCCAFLAAMKTFLGTGYCWGNRKEGRSKAKGRIREWKCGIGWIGLSRLGSRMTQRGQLGFTEII